MVWVNGLGVARGRRRAVQHLLDGRLRDRPLHGRRPPRDAANSTVLAPWREHESAPRLREDWAVTELAACAHRFCTYHAIAADLPAPVQHERVDGYRGMAATMARAATSA